VPALWLTVGASVNGVRWPERQLAAGASAPLPPGTIWQAGSSALRVRLAGEALAAETPLAHPARHHHTLLTAAAGCALLAWIAAQQWLEKRTRLDLGQIPARADRDRCRPRRLVGAVGLGSKLFQRRFRLIPHLRAVLGLCPRRSIGSMLWLALGSFALSWPWLSHITRLGRGRAPRSMFGDPCGAARTGAARAIAMIFGALCALSIGINAALTWQQQRARVRRTLRRNIAATQPALGRCATAGGVARGLADRCVKCSIGAQKEDEDREAVDGF